MRSEELLKEKRENVLDLAGKHGSRNVRVFGSVARGESGAESDIDLLVKMEEGRSLLDLSALILELRDFGYRDAGNKVSCRRSPYERLGTLEGSHRRGDINI